MMHERAIDDLLASFAEAFNTRDAKKLAALFTEDGDLVTIVAVQMAGRAAIEAGHAKLFAGALARSHLAFTGHTERSIRPDVLVCHARWRRESLATSEGAGLPPGDGIFTFVLADDGGKWRIRAAHNSQSALLPGAR